MKNVFSLFALLLFSVSLMAQNGADDSSNSPIPGDGDSPFSFEVSIGQSFGGGQSLVTAEGIKVRYFLNQNLAIRVGLGYSAWKTEDNVAENADGTGAIGTWTMKTSNFDFRAGIEQHFAATKRLSPYVALDIGFGSGSMSYDGSNSDGSNYNANYTYNEEYKTSSFGANLNAGIDFYVAKNLFLGTEFGFGMVWNTDKEGSFSVSDDGASFSGTTPENKNSASGIGAYGGIRFGWRF